MYIDDMLRLMWERERGEVRRNEVRSGERKVRIQLAIPPFRS